MKQAFIGGKMNINNLVAYLSSNGEEDFLMSIKDEVCEYINKMNKKGNSSNVYVSGSFEKLIFTNHNLVNLLHLYMEGKLLEWDLDYILNGVELCGIYCEEKAEHAISILASSEMTMIINKDNVDRCLKYLQNKTKSINYKGSTTGNCNYRSVFCN